MKKSDRIIVQKINRYCREIIEFSVGWHLKILFQITK